MLPEHLKIGYEIVRVSTGTADFELQGEFDADEARIIVAAKGSPRRRMATLMHEILHACWDQAEMSDIADHDKEEQIVNRLASVLTAVLLDNPQLRQAIETAAQNGNSTCWRPDNERRNEQSKHCPATGYKCLTAEFCKSFNICQQIGPV